MTTHDAHGRGSAEGGPEEPDCSCRGGPEQTACAKDGCGFCRAAGDRDDLFLAQAAIGVARNHQTKTVAELRAKLDEAIGVTDTEFNKVLVALKSRLSLSSYIDPETMSAEDLIRVLKDPDSSNATLTEYAEVAGRRVPEAMAVPVLLELLKHPSALAREGAILGLTHFDENETAKVAIRALSLLDPVESIRTVATRALCFFD